MKPDDWDRVHRVFEQALDHPPEARRAFVAEACADQPALANEVSALLDAHDRTGDLAPLPGEWLGALAAPEPHRFAPGDRVADRYEIRRLLGLGGMGEVYEAWDETLSIEVALKVLRVALDTEESHRRLKMEGFLARSVWHPNVCRVYDLGRHDEGGGATWFLTMERLEGVTLSDRLRAVGPLPPESARRIAGQVAAALAAAHDAGVVHCDLKPGNIILVERDGGEQAVVTDFGIARWSAEPEHGGSERGPVVGTPAYMAPEQIRGEPAGPATDLYALGVVLHEMATGRLPSRDAPPGLDPLWEAVVLRCLEREPQRRFRHAHEVAAALAGRMAVETSDAAPTATRPKLPAERDDFFGRADEIASMERSFADGARLVTLVGAAGMGKTRLAVHYGWRNSRDFPGGVWFCDLRDGGGLDGVTAATARALGLTLGRLEPVEQIGRAIAGRGRCLLVLDNFDENVEHAAASVGRWIEAAPEASFLVTSRERLRLDGAERVHPIEPLTPETALDLFAARARWLQPGLALRGAELEAAREVVRLVDCMPLAIELAAARVRVMTVPQIVAQMRDRFRLLTGGSTTRHETLEVAIDGSWDLLTRWERVAWAHCSLFEDGFTLDAAEQVVAFGDGADAPPLVDLLRSLADRSLVRADASRDAGAGGVRFRMYVSLQEYARKRLAESGAERGRDAEAAERRHGAWCARFGADDAVERLDAKGGAERRRALERERSNLVAACRRAMRRADGPVAAAAYRAAVEVFSLRGPLTTGVELGLEILNGLALDLAERIRVLWSLSRMERLSGSRAARGHAEEALVLARRSSDRRLVAALAGWVGNLEYDDGEAEAARVHYHEALAVHREFGDHGREGVVLSHVGILHHVKGEFETAGAHYEAALALLRRAGDRRREGFVYGYLGTLHRGLGRFADALAMQTEALAISRELGDRSYECQTVGNLGNLHLEMGNVEEARGCYESAVATAREMGDRRNEGLFLGNLGRLHVREDRLPEARACFEAALDHHRVAGTRAQEGYALGSLGRLSHREGRLESARGELAEAESILREAGHYVELCEILCSRGALELDESDVAAANATLAEVEAMAVARGWGPEGERGAMIAALRDAIAARG